MTDEYVCSDEDGSPITFDSSALLLSTNSRAAIGEGGGFGTFSAHSGSFIASGACDWSLWLASAEAGYVTSLSWNRSYKLLSIVTRYSGYALD